MFPAYFLSSYVLGVRLDGPVQKKSLLIEPRLGNLTEASGTVVTEFGPVSVAWKQDGAHWNYEVDASQLSSAITINLRLPVGPQKFSAELDGTILNAGAKGIKQEGRWLEVPLTSRKHQGFWKSSPN
jgi:hypothetical protein